MAEDKQTTSDEIDLGQLFQLMNKGFNTVFHSFLRFFLYIKKNIFILIGLGVLGVLVGFGLLQIISERVKTEVMVQPHILRKDYLYDVIDEIQANIKAGNTGFFDSLDIDGNTLAGLQVEIKPLSDKTNKLEEELKYLNLLKGVDISPEVSVVIEDQILSRNSRNHKITFYYKEGTNGEEAAKKIMHYINSNPFYNDLVDINVSNAKTRIENNGELIGQLNKLIEQYTDNLALNNDRSSDGRIVLDEEKEIDIPNLFRLKSELIRDIEDKKIDLRIEESVIRVVNFGRPQKVITPFFGNPHILLPLIFIGAFFLLSILKYLNKKASEMQ